MPRLTQSELHSNFSSESGTWTGYRAEVTGFYADYPNSELDRHISREYNRKISNLGQDDSLYLHPYDAGFGYRGDGYNFYDILGNAAAAYSLRSIDPTKDPNVVKVRRSSDNSTKDFKASEIGTTLTDWVGAGNDGYVTTWFDQGTNGSNATQTTSSSQPKIVDSGTLVTENGKAALDFDGSDDYLIVSSYESATDALSLFITMKFVSNGATQRIYNWDDALTSDRAWFFTIGSNKSNYFGVSSGGSSIKYKAYLDDETQNLKTSIHNGANTATEEQSFFNDGQEITGFTDNVNEATEYNSIYQSTRDITIGAGYRAGIIRDNFKGVIQEIVQFNTDQSANRVQMENSIINYYNIS